MSSRLSEVNARLETLRQLNAVITAIRGIAAARAREARERLNSVEAYARGVGEAISAALSLLPEPPRAHAGVKGPILLLAFCAEQGFAGAFSRKVLEESGAARGGEVLLVGARGLVVAEEMGVTVAWSTPMIAHVDQTAALAETLVQKLYARLADGAFTAVRVAHAKPGAGGMETIVTPLLPLDFTRFPRATGAGPLTTLPAPELAGKLAQEYVFALLCEAILLSYAAESEARMLALLAARTNVERKFDALSGDARRLRQDGITDEVIELTVGAAAARGD